MPRPTAGQLEQRAAPEHDGAAPTLEGRRLRGLIPYGVESRDLGGWREVMERGSLAKAATADLVATVDHAGVPLARFPTTLEIEDRDDGLHWALELPESRADVREAVERGDLRSTSWRMVVGRDRWQGNVRRVEEVRELRDVAIVCRPAYAEARAEYRAAPEAAPPAEPEPASEPAPEPAEEGETVRAEDRGSGGLAVEDRSAAAGQGVEARVLDALRDVRKGEVRALTTAATISPGDLGTVLFDKLRPQSVGLRSGFRVITTDGDSIVWPTLTADVVPSWTAEAAPITPGDPTFASITATPRKLAHLVQLSNEVIDDSDPSIIEVLNDHLLRVLALKLDIGLFDGSGVAPEIRGLKNVPGIQTISMGANGAALASLDTIADALALLDAANVPELGRAIVMAPRTFNTIRKFKATSGEYILASEGPTGTTPRTLFGVPVYVSGQIPVTETQGSASNASSVYVYCAPEVVYVRRQEIELELDRSRLFNSDQSELRAKLRGDLIVPNPTAVVRVLGVTP